MSSTDFAIIDGRLVPLAEASISVLDLGFLRGLGVFETLRTYGGQPHALARHCGRLTSSAAALGIAVTPDQERLRTAIADARRRGGATELRINLIVTPGRHTDGVFGAAAPTEVAILRELPEPPRSWYEEGISVVTFTGERIHPEFKTTAYITGRQGLLKAEAAGAGEALYCDPQGEVAEGVTSNVLALREGRIVTPRLPNLPGITRAGIFALAAERGIGHREERLTVSDLLSAEEVWVCSAIRELVPVVSIDGRAIGNGRPGPVARELAPAYRRRCEVEATREAAAFTSAGSTNSDP